MSCFRTTTYGTITPRSARERRLYRARKILSSFFCIPYLLSHTQHGVPKGEGRRQVPGKSFLFFLLPDRIFFSTARPISEGSSSLQRFPGDQLTWSQPQGRAGIQASRPNNTRHFLLFHRGLRSSNFPLRRTGFPLSSRVVLRKTIYDRLQISFNDLPKSTKD